MNKTNSEAVTGAGTPTSPRLRRTGAQRNTTIEQHTRMERVKRDIRREQKGNLEQWKERQLDDLMDRYDFAKKHGYRLSQNEQSLLTALLLTWAIQNYAGQAKTKENTTMNTTKHKTDTTSTDAPDCSVKTTQSKEAPKFGYILKDGEKYYPAAPPQPQPDKDDDGKLSREDWRQLALTRYERMEHYRADRDQYKAHAEALAEVLEDARLAMGAGKSQIRAGVLHDMTASALIQAHYKANEVLAAWRQSCEDCYANATQSKAEGDQSRVALATQEAGKARGQS